MGCLLGKGVPVEKLREESGDSSFGGVGVKSAGVLLTNKYVNRDVDMSVNADGSFARGSRLPGIMPRDAEKSAEGSDNSRKHRRIRSVGTAPRIRKSTSKKASALPWKANVLTPFGPGKVSKIARRADGIAEVTLVQWTLAGGAKVRIYSPAFSVRSHHRNLSSIDSLKSSSSNANTTVSR